MSNNMFLGYFMKDEKVIDESLGGLEIFAIRNEKGLYNEMLTGIEFEKANYENNKGLTFFPCQIIDPNIRNRDIVKYRFLYDKEDIYALIDRINFKSLTKHK